MKADYVTMATRSESEGTWLQGTIATTYDKLVETFGEPNGSPREMETAYVAKTNSLWILKFPDGTIATIYDWKLKNTPTDLYDWHIGGHNKKAVGAVLSAVYLR
jgi:hypothetical protein